MKVASLPPLRVTQETRAAVEELLRDGESLSAFVEEAVRLNVERRQVQREFLARGLAAGEEARRTGDYATPEEVMSKLRAMRKAHASRVKGK
ncbi:MAG: prevent-host-death protein [Methylibium sp.]|uniref:YlcI/YnfO family protein n=1 Tax=Methylibium sp. TaxID=2067992 RepID=UPI0017A06AC3|nr:YlcI/YnfO family protein [Methylibium sp.]MBA3598802.1 prevent-host-death protein [Methylibium sp.]